jgi:hypothetical protein
MLTCNTLFVSPKHCIAFVARPVDAHPDRFLDAKGFPIETDRDKVVGCEVEVEALDQFPRAFNLHL